MRGDFPLLAREVNGQPLAYLSAASAQKPQAVIDRELEFYRHGYAAVHRGIHTLSAEATQQMEALREQAARVLSTPPRRKRWCSSRAPLKASIWWPTALAATCCSRAMRLSPSP